MASGYETLDHTADVGFRAWAGSMAELFEVSASAMLAMATLIEDASAPAQIEVELDAPNPSALLVNWLNEILFYFDSGQWTPVRFTVDEIGKTHLRARIAGEPRDLARHRWTVIVKAATYYETEVIQRNGRWEAKVFLDV